MNKRTSAGSVEGILIGFSGADSPELKSGLGF